MKEAEQEFIPVQDALKQLETTKATFYKHLKKVKRSTIKRKGRAYIESSCLDCLRKSLGSVETSSAKLNEKDSSNGEFNLGADVLNETLQAKLSERDERIQGQDKEIVFLRSQIEELTSTLNNQQKLALMDKSLLQSMKQDMELLEDRNQTLEKTQTKDARVLKVVQLAIYFSLLLTLAVVNYKPIQELLQGF